MTHRISIYGIKHSICEYTHGKAKPWLFANKTGLAKLKGMKIQEKAGLYKLNSWLSNCR